MVRNVIHIASVMLVFSALAAIGVGTWLAPTTHTFEKRKLALIPEVPKQLDDWKAWPGDMEKWWSDAGYRRQDMVRIYNRLRETLGISPQSDVLIGKEGWLFFTGGDVLDDYRNSRLYSKEELDRWEAYLLHRHHSAKQHGAMYYLVIPPNKHNVYPEYLPRHIVQLSPRSRLDQIIERMYGTEVRIIDLRPVLLEAKQHRQAYHKGDSHWNLWGAYAAQYAVLDKIKSDFPDLKIQYYAPEDFVDSDALAFRDAHVHYYNALHFMLGAERQEKQPLLVMPERSCVKPAPLDIGRWQKLQKKVRERLFLSEQCDSGRYRALLFCDSFSELLRPFFSTTFAYSAYLRFRKPVSQQYWDHFIEAADPDIVIDEMISRHLRHIPRPDIDYPARNGEASDALADEEHYEFD